jgi:hypothetical protein
MRRVAAECVAVSRTIQEMLPIRPYVITSKAVGNCDHVRLLLELKELYAQGRTLRHVRQGKNRSVTAHNNRALPPANPPQKSPAPTSARVDDLGFNFAAALPSWSAFPTSTPRHGLPQSG